MCLRYASAGLFSVERLGRKPLLAGSLVVMVVGLCLLAVAFLLMHPEDVAISGAEIGKEAVSNSVYFTGLCVFNLSFCSSPLSTRHSKVVRSAILELAI